ncbi:hypothetical protein V6N13_104720 [Hibiscus sabdariffa]
MDDVRTRTCRQLFQLLQFNSNKESLHPYGSVNLIDNSQRIPIDLQRASKKSILDVVLNVLLVGGILDYLNSGCRDYNFLHVLHDILLAEEFMEEKLVSLIHELKALRSDPYRK